MIDLENELKNCFQLVSGPEPTCTFKMTLPAQLTFYLGHFPDFPVLPAVAFVDISVFLAQKSFPAEHLSNENLKTVKHIKIKKPLAYQVPFTVQITKQNQTYEFEWQDYASVSLQFSP